MSVDSFESHFTIISAKVKKTSRRTSTITRTDSVCKSVSRRQKTINQYIIMDTLGVGSYGKVKKCRD